MILTFFAGERLEAVDFFLLAVVGLAVVDFAADFLAGVLALVAVDLAAGLAAGLVAGLAVVFFTGFLVVLAFVVAVLAVLGLTALLALDAGLFLALKMSMTRLISPENNTHLLGRSISFDLGGEFDFAADAWVSYYH
jgi:hypothetical protein